MQQCLIGLPFYTHTQTHTDAHETDEQSQCDRLLMTDTRLMLSGGKGVKALPQRGTVQGGFLLRFVL